MSHSCTAITHRISKLMAMNDTALRQHLETAAADEPLRTVHLCYELETAQRQREFDRPELTRAIAKTLRECAANLALHA